MRLRWLRSALILLACFGLLASPVVAAEPIVRPAPSSQKLIMDLVLAEGDVLRGEVWNSSGHAQIATDVVLWKDADLIGRTLTDADGKFRFEGLPTGLYRIATPDATIACRVWSERVAPPNARQSLLIVTNMYSARGQQPINEVFCFNPFLMGTIIAAAIAIPIAVHNSGDGQLADGS